ncbi:MAG: hypothetical protein FJW95_08660 [Actinobacteria bacterium]|nr:hypothetical protein [Actinomycetota bacterium]
MISIIVAVTVFSVVTATIVLFARDRGPQPGDIAISYELAWDRLDFEALWSLSGDELRDGLDKKAFVGAKRAAYAGRSDLGHLIARVDLDIVDVGLGFAHVRTRVTLHSGEVVRNDVMFTRRSSAWVVTGYALAPDPQQTA